MTELTRREVLMLGGLALGGDLGAAMNGAAGSISETMKGHTLEARMEQEKIFNRGTVKLNYLESGSSCDEPMLMLHGGAWCWQEFLSLIPALSQERHIFALDLRGNGRSGWMPGHYGLSDFVNDVMEFLALIERPAVITGHSIGGVIALMAAARRPEKVKALIIEDAPLALDNYKNVIDASRDMFLQWLELKKKARSEGELTLALADRYRGYPGVTSPWILFFGTCLWRLDPTFFDMLLHNFTGFTAGYDYKQILSKLSCPLLFIRGDMAKGAVMRDDEISWLEDNCVKGEFITIKGVGHLLHLQDHGQAPVLDAMKAFLRRAG